MSVMDWIGFVTGVVCVFLILREKDINWPIGLLNSVALLVVFWTQKLYAQATGTVGSLKRFPQ
jgi:nicotinamide mononucleotide transporter